MTTPGDPVDGAGAQSDTGDVLRLPQDVALGSKNVPVELSDFDEPLSFYIAQHDWALSVQDFGVRTQACWGMIAHGKASLPWIEAQLTGGSDADVFDDAVGVLSWVGMPQGWKSPLTAIANALPDGEKRDTLFELLGHDDSTEAAPADAQLFGGRLLPMTEPIWFVRLPFGTAAAEMTDWLHGLGKATERFRAPLPQALQRLDPAVNPPRSRTLLVGTTGPWTALFSAGADVYNTDVVGRRANALSLKTHFTPHIVRDRRIINYGSRAFWLHFPGEFGERYRTIQASYQSRWDWDLGGEPQPFEDTSRYTARKITDRFDLDLLNQYCAALGIRRADPEFYTEECMLAD
ncbi:hypothetical protein [Solicola sp. PLA-1-18]|uniref:hypothetical protein n=1 Tax=Solicola sp. PLA-1-18 TaxID=3380532 RepID=UPI003B7B0D8F